MDLAKARGDIDLGPVKKSITHLNNLIQAIVASLAVVGLDAQLRIACELVALNTASSDLAEGYEKLTRTLGKLNDAIGKTRPSWISMHTVLTHGQTECLLSAPYRTIQMQTKQTRCKMV